MRGGASGTGMALALAALLAACGGEPAAEQVPRRSVVLVETTARIVEEKIEATGELLAKHRAEVAAQVGGEITQILFDEGARVEEGDIVIEIDPERRNLDLARAQARVAEARASLEEFQREVRRVRELAGRNVASQAQLDQAETARRTGRSRLLAAEADLGVADRALRDASVTASFAGLIARRFVSRGEFVQAGQRLFELVSLDPIEVEFHLPERDSSRVRVGLPIEVSVAPYPREVFLGVVTVVSPTIDPRTRTLRVKALLPNPDGRLRPGLFARTDLGIAKREGVLMLPEEAVLQRSDGAVVFRVVGGDRVERRLIETGPIRKGLVEVVKGLSVGDLVVRRGHSDLIDGSLIVARNPDGTPAVSADPRPVTEGSVRK